MELHFAGDLLTTATVDNLQLWLAVKAPKMSTALEVEAFERDPDRVRVDVADPHGLRAAVAERGLSRGPLYRELVDSHGPPADGERRFGSALVRGTGAGTSGRYLTVRFDSTTPLHRMGASWHWSNSIGASLRTSKREWMVRCEWIRQLGAALADDPAFLWGAAYMSGEFEASNLDSSNGGLRAIGRDVSRHLPGLYWLNFFGRPYTSMMAVDDARRTGIGVWNRAGEATIFECFSSPDDWATAAKDKRDVMDALGADLFFDRRSPERETRAPDFGVPLVSGSPPRPFEVFTSDGVNFTELPPH